MRAPRWTETWRRASFTSRPAWTTWAECWGVQPPTTWSSTLNLPQSGFSTSAVSRYWEQSALRMISLTWQDYKIQTNELTFTFLILIPLKLWRFFAPISEYKRKKPRKVYSDKIPREYNTALQTMSGHRNVLISRCSQRPAPLGEIHIRRVDIRGRGRLLWLQGQLQSAARQS